MARQVSGAGLQVEQKDSTNNRRVESTGLMVEEKATPNNRRVSSSGILIEYKPGLEVNAVSTFIEWDIPQNRQVSSMQLMFEWDLQTLYGTAYGSSTVTGNLINITPIYVMPTDFIIDGTLTGNVYIQGLDSTRAFINGTLFGELRELGLTSYLWNLAKAKTLAVGVTTSLVCYLNNVEDNFDNTIIQNTLLGFGRLHGLTEGKTYFTFRVNGIAPISGRPFGTIQTKGMSLQFLQTSMAIVIHDTLFTYNGKQLVYSV